MTLVPKRDPSDILSGDGSIRLPPIIFEGQEGANGMKYDNGKLLAAIPFQDFPRALKAVAEISTYGAKKYKRSSWKTVPNAQERYEDAEFRHYLDMAIEGKTSKDKESGLLHMAHRAWNVLAVLELELIKLENNKLDYNDKVIA
jgi:hypothetical protein